jgi:hypothetical protein
MTQLAGVATWRSSIRIDGPSPPLGARLSALQPALAATYHGIGVFALFLWRAFAILNLAGQDIDHELGELVCVTGRFSPLGPVGIRVTSLEGSSQLLFPKQ